ncbi:MAG TPA: hypothetical protein VFM39_07165 [bacterium]|nr:hypothetical protein [bacterium]
MGGTHRLFVGALAAVIGGVAVVAVLVGPMSAQRAGTPELQLGADGFPIASEVAPLNLPPEIQRWRRHLLNTGEALKDERRAIEAEQRDLDRLRERIQGRRRHYREHGFSPAARADDQIDVMNYTHRLRALHERITAYDARLSAFRQALSEYTAHLQHAGLSRASRQP